MNKKLSTAYLILIIAPVFFGCGGPEVKKMNDETINPIELTIDFPLDSFEIPFSSGNYMRLLLPSDTMTIDKDLYMIMA
jgi:hypothetical protein